MAQTNELDALLAAIEPEADAAAGLPTGYSWGKLSDMCIGPPIAVMVESKRRNNVVSVPSPASIAALRAYRSARWPVLDTRQHPEEAQRIWEAHSLALLERQNEARRAMAPATAEPVANKGVRPLRVVRV